jgi:hypothetical protein
MSLQAHTGPLRHSGAGMVTFPVYHVETSCDGKRWDCTRPLYLSTEAARRVAAELRGTGYPFVRVRPRIAQLGAGVTS